MKKKLLLFFSLSLSIFFILPVYNFYLDRYNVFGSLDHKYGRHYVNTKTHYSYTYNDRFIPVSYLLNSTHKYNSFMFGSSKIGTLNIQGLGSNWYKLNYNSGTLQEHIYNAKLLSKNIEVKEIILAIDYSNIVGIDKPLNNNINTLLYPSNIFEWKNLINKYLFKKPNQTDFDMFFKKNYVIKNQKKLYIRVDGREKYDLRRGENHIKVFNALKMNNNKISDKKIQKTVNSIADFKTYLTSRNIKLKIILLPENYKILTAENNMQYRKFKKNLSKVINFIDFSTANEYSINPVFWKEKIHFIPAVNMDIMNTLLHRTNLCGKFGYLMDKSNIDEQLGIMSSIDKTAIDTISKYDQYSDFRLENTQLFKCEKTLYKQAKEDILKLNKINNAILSFFDDSKRYPKAGKNREWISELVPKYLKKLPNKNHNYYFRWKYDYISDTKDYKLIVKHPAYIGIVQDMNSSLIDHKRSNYAYGFWSKNAKNW